MNTTAQNAPRSLTARLLRVAAGMVVGLSAAGLGSCGGGGGSGGEPAAASSVDFRVVPVATGLDHPWSLAFLPGGDMLVTLRTGKLLRVPADGSASTEVTGALPAIDASGQGGLLDIALDPDFASNQLIYWSFSEPGTGVQAGTSGTAVARGKLVGDTVQNVAVIFRQSPKVSGSGHYGSRLAFAPDKSLFVTLGERQQDAPEAPTNANAQNLGKHLGKVVRIKPDTGLAASGNPFAATPGALPEIWSLGHRNPQGAAINPATGELWVSEHGPQGGDEVNRVVAGGNYGWPQVSYGCPYGSTPPGAWCRVNGGTHSRPGGPSYVEPATYWEPVSIAPSGIAFYNGAGFPEWNGNLFVGAMATPESGGCALWRLAINGNSVTGRERLLADLRERIRAVRQGPDGWLYVLTDGADARILRLER